MKHLSMTRLKMNEAIPLCFNKKSKNKSKGKNSLILQSSTIALLFMPPAQFKRTSPWTKDFVDSGWRKETNI